MDGSDSWGYNNVESESSFYMRVMSGALNIALTLIAITCGLMMAALIAPYALKPWIIFASLGLSAVSLYVLGAALKKCNDNKQGVPHA